MWSLHKVSGITCLYWLSLDSSLRSANGSSYTTRTESPPVLEPEKTNQEHEKNRGYPGSFSLCGQGGTSYIFFIAEQLKPESTKIGVNRQFQTMERGDSVEQILDKLWAGGPELTLNYRTVGINAILTVMGEDEFRTNWMRQQFESVFRDAEVKFRFIPLYEGSKKNSPRVYEEIATWINEHIKAGRTVGVRCAAGVVRSSVAIMAYLIHSGYSLTDALKLVESKRGPVPVHRCMWDEIREWLEWRNKRKDVS